jgi:hypothetical protein
VCDEKRIARCQFRALGHERGSVSTGCPFVDVCSVLWMRAAFVPVSFAGLVRAAELFGIPLPARFPFSAAPLCCSALLSFPFLLSLLSFAHLRVPAAIFSVFQPTHAVPDHLRCLEATSGRTPLQKLLTPDGARLKCAWASSAAKCGQTPRRRLCRAL